MTRSQAEQTIRYFRTRDRAHLAIGARIHHEEYYVSVRDPATGQRTVLTTMDDVAACKAQLEQDGPATA